MGDEAAGDRTRVTAEGKRDRKRKGEREKTKERETGKGGAEPKSNLPKDRIDRACNRTCNVSKFLAASRFVPSAMVI